MKNRYKLTAVFLAAMLALLSCASGGLPGKTPEAEKITQTETDSRETASEKETNSTEERTESTETDPGTSGEESSDITSSEKETEKETAESTSSEEETEKESTSGKSSKYELYQYAYGDNAYKYLRTINDNYPERITGNGNTDTSSRDACGAFIDREMQSFGYTAEVQSWDHFNGSDTANITSYIYHKAGNSRERVVIGAHYDCADTKGAEDNGSGVSLLLETAQRFADIPTDLSIDFCCYILFLQKL